SRRARPAWRFGLALTAAAATVAAGFAVLGDESPVELRPVSVTRFLESAASAAEKHPNVRPSPHQWIYSKTFRPAPAATRGSLPDPLVHAESWIRFDGRQSASYEPNGAKVELKIVNEKWVEHNTDSEERTPAQWYDYYRTLPADPAALLALMTERADAYMTERKAPFSSADERDQWVFRRLADFLDDGASLPSSMRATVYRAIALIPNVQIKKGTADALGRPGTSVIRTGGTPRLTEEFIIGDTAHTYLGSRVVTTVDQRIPMPKGLTASPPTDDIIKAGTVLTDEALESSAVVNTPGTRP
ncbi:CU044_5270 family protein, partial [Actinocorallia lasiicapitis]